MQFQTFCQYKNKKSNMQILNKYHFCKIFLFTRVSKKIIEIFHKAKIMLEVNHLLSAKAGNKALSKPCKGFMYHMLYGIQKAKDIKLSEISSALCEDIVVTKVYGQLIERAMTTTL